MFVQKKAKETYGQGRLPEMPSFKRSRSDRCRLGPEPIGGNDGLLRADDEDVAPEKVGGDAMLGGGDGGAGALRCIYIWRTPMWVLVREDV